MEPRNVAAMIHRHATWQIEPVRTTGTTYRHVIPRERKQVEESSRVAGFILCWFFLQRGGFLHSACAQGLNDNVGTFLRIRLLFLECFTPPRSPHQARPGEPASPEGSSCTVLLGSAIQPHRFYSQRPPERHIGRSLHTLTDGSK